MFNGYPKRKKHLVPCRECGAEKDFIEECYVCKAKEKEIKDAKDKKEFYLQFEGLTIEQKLDWILEYIREHKKSFHGHSTLDIMNMNSSPVFGS